MDKARFMRTSLGRSCETRVRASVRSIAAIPGSISSTVGTTTRRVGGADGSSWSTSSDPPLVWLLTDGLRAMLARRSLSLLKLSVDFGRVPVERYLAPIEPRRMADSTAPALATGMTLSRRLNAESVTTTLVAAGFSTKRNRGFATAERFRPSLRAGHTALAPPADAEDANDERRPPGAEEGRYKLFVALRTS